VKTALSFVHSGFFVLGPPKRGRRRIFQIAGRLIKFSAKAKVLPIPGNHAGYTTGEPHETRLTSDLTPKRRSQLRLFAESIFRCVSEGFCLRDGSSRSGFKIFHTYHTAAITLSQSLRAKQADHTTCTCQNQQATVQPGRKRGGHEVAAQHLKIAAK